jgi:hypothetical protein
MFIAAWILASCALGFLGRNRAMGFWGFFLFSLILSPLLCLGLLLLTAPLPRGRQTR